MAKKWPTGIRPSGKGIRVTIYGRRGQKAVYDETIPGNAYNPSDLAAAERHRADLKRRYELGLSLGNAKPGRLEMFGDAAQRWIESTAVDVDTKRNYFNQLNRYWMPVFGERIIQEITRDEIKERVAELPLKPSSKRTVISPLTSIFEHAGVMPNPAAKIPVGKVTPGRVERYTPEERDALLAKLKGQSRVYFALLFGTGLRPGEALALTWADYDGSFLFVCKQHTSNKAKDHTKTSVDRRVYVPKWVREYLNNHDTRLAGQAIFVNTRGRPMKKADRLNDAWYEAHKTARVGTHPVRPRRPYTTRHTRASELLSQGVNPAEAAYELGHSVSMFLDIYARFVEEFANRRDMSKLEGIAFKEQQSDG